MTTITKSSLADVAGKYLTFFLDDEEYGLEILKVQEIIGLMHITHVPGADASVRGVINLRGKVLPVLDLRIKFGFERREDTRRTCVIVVEVHHQDRLATIGVIVDAVSEVMDIQLDQIEETPAMGACVEKDYILAMGKVGEKVVMLLDINEVLAENEVGIADTDAEEAAP